MRKIAVEIGDADEMYCNNCPRFGWSDKQGRYRCYVFDEGLTWSQTVGELIRTSQCKAAEIKQQERG